MKLRINSTVLASSVFMLAGPGAAIAQNAAPSSVEEVVVTARRVQENLQDVPLAVTAISSTALERHSIREVRDLVGMVPNLSTQTTNGTTHAILFGMRGQSSATILLSVDSPVGIYIDSVNLPHAYGAATALVDLDRVEVLRGPQGTLYGRNTTGGTISFITKDPYQGFGGKLEASVGNYGLYQGTAAINVPMGENLAGRFVIFGKKLKGYGQDLAGRDLLGEKDFLFRGKIKGRLGERVSFTLGSDYIDYANTGPAWHITGLAPGTNTLLIQEYTRARGLPLTPENLASTLAIIQPLIGGPADFRDSFTRRKQYSDFRGLNTTLNLEAEISDDLSARSISGYREFKSYSDFDLDGAPVTIQESPIRSNAKFFSEELQLLGGDQKFNWVTGLYYSDEKGTETNLNIALPIASGGAVTQNDGDLRSKSYAAFGQFNWRFADEWTLSAGARWTKETRGLITRNRRTNGTCLVPVEFRERADLCRGTIDISFNKPSWLASIKYQPSDGLNIYAKAARGFRGGGHNMRGTSVGTYAPFEPETVTEYELGAKTELFDRTLRLNLAAFYDDYKNAQRSVLILVGTSTVTRITNAASATLKGLEGEAVWRPVTGLTLEGSFGLTDAKYDKFVDFTGNRSNEPWPTPKWTAALGARYEHPVGMGQLAYQLNYNYHSKHIYAPAVVFKDQVTQKAIGMFDGRITLSLEDSRTDISVFGRNLTNKEYFVAAVALEPLGFNTMATGEPRTFGVQVVRRFGKE